MEIGRKNEHTINRTDYAPGLLLLELYIEYATSTESLRIMVHISIIGKLVKIDL